MDNSSEIIEMHAIFSGRVQGVGFRMTIKYHATALHLTGIVRNLPDGRVETNIQGTQKNLEAFISRVNAQPGAASLDSIETHFEPLSSPCSNFRVIY